MAVSCITCLVVTCRAIHCLCTCSCCCPCSGASCPQSSAALSRSSCCRQITSNRLSLLCTKRARCTTRLAFRAHTQSHNLLLQTATVQPRVRPQQTLPPHSQQQQRQRVPQHIQQPSSGCCSTGLHHIATRLSTASSGCCWLHWRAVRLSCSSPGTCCCSCKAQLRSRGLRGPGRWCVLGCPWPAVLLQCLPLLVVAAAAAKMGCPVCAYHQHASIFTDLTMTVCQCQISSTGMGDGVVMEAAMSRGCQI